MNNKKQLALLLSLFALASCNGTKDIIVDNFESGTFDKWTVEGDAFGTTPSKGGYSGQQDVKGFEGTYLANSFNNGDDSRGTLISKEFKIERDFINFLIGGGKHADTYIELIVDGKSVCKSRSLVESETLQWMTWNVEAYKGKNAVIKIVDNQRGEWGHILIDEIEQSNVEKSIVMANYKMPFDVNSKFLLVPIEDDAPTTAIELDVDDRKVGVPMDIRVARTKIDYWIPIEVEGYKGKRVTLVFDHVKKGDIGYEQIKQSNVFDYNYNEKFRPLYHFSPKYGWMNDPNGMVYKDGEYHLFYQYNPYGSLWANMHWGHATSKDLTRWEYQPVALSPDSLGAIFSGSAVVDKNNTAGFGKDAIIAIYTSAGKTQTQSIAYSTDNGRTFTKYGHNPVLADPAISDFRDPKVSWNAQSQQWVMALATSQTISFYGSKNLKEWSKLSEFGKGIGAHGGVWECPDLFPLTYNGQTKWVLIVSINPGGPNNSGSATQYFIGNFDGKTFKPDNLPYPLWIDYGRDNYAGITWSNAPDKKAIFIGWMSNWDYANQVPSVNFGNAMTLPRELSLVSNGKHLVVASKPVKEVALMRAETIELGKISTEKEYVVEKLMKVNDGAYELEMEVDASSVSEGFSLSLQNTEKDEVRFDFDLAGETLSVDRTKSGIVDLNDKFATPVSKAPLVKKDKYKIRLFVDKASTELFVDDGVISQTNIVFPNEPFNTLVVNSKKGNLNITDLKVYRLK